MSDKPAIPRSPSREFVRLNPHLFGLGNHSPASRIATVGDGGDSRERPRIVLRLTGQVRGGKNAVGVNRKTGTRYAKPRFRAWRAEMMAQINRQDIGGILITEPTNLRIDYVAGDRKRRDQTGIFDAIFHLLEYAQIIADDSLLWVTESSRTYNKQNPKVTITFL